MTTSAYKYQSQPHDIKPTMDNLRPHNQSTGYLYTADFTQAEQYSLYLVLIIGWSKIVYKHQILFGKSVYGLTFSLQIYYHEKLCFYICEFETHLSI